MDKLSDHAHWGDQKCAPFHTMSAACNAFLPCSIFELCSHTCVSLVFSSSAAVYNVLPGQVLSQWANENQGGAHQVKTQTIRWSTKCEEEIVSKHMSHIHDELYYSQLGTRFFSCKVNCIVRIGAIVADKCCVHVAYVWEYVCITFTHRPDTTMLIIRGTHSAGAVFSVPSEL